MVRVEDCGAVVLRRGSRIQERGNQHSDCFNQHPLTTGHEYREYPRSNYLVTAFLPWIL